MNEGTFSGLIDELPGVSVDNFDDSNRRRSVIFLLSHCHADHMRGLSKMEPLPGPLYLSAISSVIVRHKYPQHSAQIRKLDLRTTLSVAVDPGNASGYELRVTAIAANHCPGSVMFLMESRNISVLYTGDCRVSREEIDGITARHRPKILYVDSTFYHPEYEYFPNRSQSTASVVSLCRDWLQRDMRHVVSLWLSASYGSEYLFQELSKELGERIHVSDKQYGEYRHFDALDQTLTTDGNARVHACRGVRNHRTLLCRGELSPEHIRIIKPSATRWRHLRQGQQAWVYKNGIYYVCYSNHASYGEIRQLLQQLQPTPCNVRYNVARENHGLEAMQQLTRDLLATKNEQYVGLSSDNAFYLNSINYKYTETSNNDGDESDTECQSSLPKRKTK